MLMEPSGSDWLNWIFVFVVGCVALSWLLNALPV